MSEKIYLLSIFLPLATAILIFGMRYYSAVQQARARYAHDEAYRQMAATALAAQSQSAAALASIEATLAELRARLAAIEKVLKEVE